MYDLQTILKTGKWIRIATVNTRVSLDARTLKTLINHLRNQANLI